MEIEPAPMDSHRLAVLCLVLGLGALLDLEKPSLSAEAMRYYQLGRAALSVDSVLESQSIPAIQALVRICPWTRCAFYFSRDSSCHRRLQPLPCASHRCPRIVAHRT